MNRILYLYLIFLAWPCYAGLPSPGKQPSYDTVTSLIKHHKQRVRQFSRERTLPGKIIFLGNSITEMAPFTTLIGDTVLNRGIGGDLSYSILGRMHDIVIRKPSRLFLMIGINDIGKDIPIENTLANCRKIIDTIQLKSPATLIFLQSVLPVNPAVPSFPAEYAKKGKIDLLNGRLKELANERKVEFVDLRPLFTGTDGNLKEQYTMDGLHLKPEGYTVWVDYLRSEHYIP